MELTYTEGNVLYKFKSLDDTKTNGKSPLDYAIDSLENNYFYFSRPVELNDPFDNKIQLSFTATGEEIDAHIEYMRTEYANDPHCMSFNVAQYPYTNVSPQNPNYMESCRARIRKLKNSIEWQNNMRKVNEETRDRFHILSLTLDVQNEHLWEDYANKHTGIAIGYKYVTSPQNEKFIACEHTDIPNVALDFSDGSQKYFLAYEMGYANTKPAYKYFSNQRENIIFNLRNKGKKWAPEKEHRGLLLTANPAEVLKVYYADNVLESITFGYAASSSQIDAIKNAVKRNASVQFYQMDRNLTPHKI